MKKIKLAFRDSRVLMSFIIGLVVAILFTTLELIEPEEVYDWKSGSNVSILLALYYGALMIFLMPDTSGVGLKFMKTLPLTHRDITDVRILEHAVTALMYFAAQALWLVIFRRADMVIYYLCSYMIILAMGAAISSLLANRNERPASGKKEYAVSIVKAIFCALVLPFAAALLGTAVCAGGFNGTLSVGAALLICGICAIVTILFDLIYRNIIKYYIQ